MCLMPCPWPFMWGLPLLTVTDLVPKIPKVPGEVTSVNLGNWASCGVRPVVRGKYLTFLSQML